MKISLKQLIISATALLIAVLILLGFVRNPALVGEQPLILRALILDSAMLAAQ